MRIAIINEVSAADKNEHILKALEGFDHEIINLGMKSRDGDRQLQYIHTGFLTGLFLNAGKADFVVGGCGTGMGYLNAAAQFPAVFCGHVLTALDAWLFAQINGGNCISLALNQGYGWAGDANLSFIFEKLFSVEFGCGYPVERKIPQGESREKLCRMSVDTHYDMGEIINRMDDRIVKESLDFPGVAEALDLESLEEGSLKDSLRKYL